MEAKQPTDQKDSPPSHAARGSVELLPTPRNLIPLQLAIEKHLKKIEELLGPNYNLTLLAKYHGPLKDADILLSLDTVENMRAVIERFFPPNDQAERPGN